MRVHLPVVAALCVGILLAARIPATAQSNEVATGAVSRTARKIPLSCAAFDALTAAAANGTGVVIHVCFTNDPWFEVGEDLTYRLYWGLFTVGEAKLTSEWIEEDGRKLIRLKTIATTGRIVSQIYPVNDTIVSIVEPETFLPVRYIQKLNEDGDKRDEITEFDHVAGTAYWKSLIDNSTTNIAIDVDTRDALSFLYFMRSADFGVGQTQKFRVLVDDTIYDLLLAGLNYEEVYLAKFGDIECLKVEPQAKFGSIFVRKGKIYMWFSDDERLVCTKVEAVLPVANLKAILRAVKGPGKDFWTSGKRRKGKKGKQSGGRKEQEPGSSRTAVTSNALSDTLLRTGKTAQD